MGLLARAEGIEVRTMENQDAVHRTLSGARTAVGPRGPGPDCEQGTFTEALPAVPSRARLTARLRARLG